jgi:hypothetical protein
MDNFECIRCGYITNKKSSIICHINRKKKCNRLLESLKYNDEEIYNLSLIRKKDREKSEKKCKNCNKIYCNKYFLEKHIKYYCKEINNIKEEDNIKKEILQNTYIENQQNIGNQQNIENQQNIYITQNISIPIPFDKDWNTEHMDLYLKQLLLLAENKYTDLLKKILENKSNLNVILDKKTNIGYVYNSNKEYQNMDKSEIAILSMEKLYNELNKIKNEVITNDSKISVKNINEESLKIEDKYSDFISNKNTQKKVEECISNIYDTKKEEARIIFNNLPKMNEINDGY